MDKDFRDLQLPYTTIYYYSRVAVRLELDAGLSFFFFEIMDAGLSCPNQRRRTKRKKKMNVEERQRC